MLKKLAVSISALSALAMMTSAAAEEPKQPIDDMPVSHYTFGPNGIGSKPIIVTSSDGDSWTNVQTGDLLLPVKIQFDVPDGQMAYYAIYHGYLKAYYAELLNYDAGNPTNPPIGYTDMPLYEATPNAKMSTTNLHPLQRQEIIDQCNAMGRPDQEYSFNTSIDLTLSSTFWINTYFGEDAVSPTNDTSNGSYMQGQWRKTSVSNPVICQKGIKATNDLAKADDPFKVTSVDLSLKTYSSDTHQPQPGLVCPVLHVTTRVTSNQAGLAGADRIEQINGGANKTTALFMGTSQQADGSFASEQTQKYYLGQGTHAKFYARAKSGQTMISTPWKSITIQCKGPGSGLAVDTLPPDDPPQLAKYSGEITVADWALTPRNKCPREGQAVFKISSSVGTPVDYKVDCTGGRSWQGTMQMSDNGAGKYQGVAARTFDVTKTEMVTCALKRVKGNTTQVLSISGHQFTCIRPTLPPATPDLTVDRPKPDLPSVVLDLKTDHPNQNSSGCGDAGQKRLAAARAKNHRRHETRLLNLNYRGSEKCADKVADEARNKREEAAEKADAERRRQAKIAAEKAAERKRQLKAAAEKRRKAKLEAEKQRQRQLKAAAEKRRKALLQAAEARRKRAAELRRLRLKAQQAKVRNRVKIAPRKRGKVGAAARRIMRVR